MFGDAFVCHWSGSWLTPVMASGLGSVQSYYMNQCWLTVSWSPVIAFKSNLNHTTTYLYARKCKLKMLSAKFRTDICVFNPTIRLQHCWTLEAQNLWNLLTSNFVKAVGNTSTNDKAVTASQSNTASCNQESTATPISYAGVTYLRLKKTYVPSWNIIPLDVVCGKLTHYVKCP